jgi:hypothetical protein
MNIPSERTKSLDMLHFCRDLRFHIIFDERTFNNQFASYIGSHKYNEKEQKEAVLYHSACEKETNHEHARDRT